MAFRIDRQSRCAVIGYGSWATALVKILLENETSVGWYIRNREVLESVRRNETNPRYLRDVHFDTGRLRTSDDLNETVRSAEVIVLAVPSVYLKTTLEPTAATACRSASSASCRGRVTPRRSPSNGFPI